MQCDTQREIAVDDVPNSGWRRLFHAGLIAAILLLALGLRAYRLDQQSLWMDEDLAVRHLSAPDLWTHLQLLAVLVPEQAAGPLYFMVQYYWAQLVGTDMVALRILPVLLGMSAILCVFLLGKRLYGTAAGLVAALLMALSPMHIWHAQEVRPYALVMPLAALSIYALLRGLHEKGFRWWTVNLVLNACLLWTHLFLVLFVGIQGFFLLTMVGRATWRRAFVWWGAHAILLAIWLVWLWFIMQYVHFFHSAGVPAAEIYLNTVARDVVNLHTDLLPAWKSYPSFPLAPLTARLLSIRPYCDFALVLIISGALAGFAVLTLRDWRSARQQSVKQRAHQEAGLLLVMMLAFSGPTLGVLENLFHRIVMNPMYSMFDTVALYIAIGAVVARLRPRVLRLGACLVIAALYGFQLAIFLPEVTRLNWRAGASHIRANAGPHDLVMRLQHFWPDHSFEYYMRGAALETWRVLTFQAACDDSAAFLQSPANGTPQDGAGPSVWLVFEQLPLKWVFPSFDPATALSEDLRHRGLTCTGKEFPGHYNLIVFRITRASGIPVIATRDPVTPMQPIGSWRFPLQPPDYGHILTELGLGALEGPGRQKALDGLRESIDFWPIDTFPLGTKLFYLDPIFDLLERGHPEVAEALARFTIAKFPSFGLAHFALGTVLAAQQKHDEARDSFNEARRTYRDLDNIAGSFMDAVSIRPDRDRAVAEAKRLVDMGFAFAPALYDTWRRPEIGSPAASTAQGR